MTLYSYNGPVLAFEKCICHQWRAQTYAVSEAKARSNLAYQFKIETGRVPRSRITLPGKIIAEGAVIDERSSIHPELA